MVKNRFLFDFITNGLVHRLKYPTFNAIFSGIFNPVIIQLSVLKVTQFNVVKIEKTV